MIASLPDHAPWLFPAALGYQSATARGSRAPAAPRPRCPTTHERDLHPPRHRRSGLRRRRRKSRREHEQLVTVTRCSRARRSRRTGHRRAVRSTAPDPPRAERRLARRRPPRAGCCRGERYFTRPAASAVGVVPCRARAGASGRGSGRGGRRALGRAAQQGEQPPRRPTSARSAASNSRRSVRAATSRSGARSAEARLGAAASAHNDLLRALRRRSARPPASCVSVSSTHGSVSPRRTREAPARCHSYGSCRIGRPSPPVEADANGDYGESFPR
jgi:hypothetical protein